MKMVFEDFTVHQNLGYVLSYTCYRYEYLVDSILPMGIRGRYGPGRQSDIRYMIFVEAFT